MHPQFYAIVTILLCLSSRYSLVEIKLELQKNILKFGYGINYKYEGMLAHLFDRFYVVTKFILPTLDDMRLSPTEYDENCNCLRRLDDQNDDTIQQNIRDLLLYCAKLKPYMYSIKCHNTTAHNILKNEVGLILPKFYENQKSKRGIFSALILGFIG